MMMRSMTMERFVINNYFILMLSLLLLLTFLISDIHCVRITSVNIPSYYTLDNDDNTPDHIILDCPYEIDDDETNLLVKWFKDGETIYHWILRDDGSNMGTAYPGMKDKINTSYEASDDPRQRYRAVQFINPTLDLTGDYKCLIQTTQSLDLGIRHLEILDMTNITFKLNTERRDDDTLITCSASNIQPKPTLELRLNENEEIEIDNEYVFDDDPEGYFEVIVKGNISNDKIDSNSEFGCLLSFEGTNYTRWYSELNSGKINLKPSIEFSLISSFVILILSTFIKDLI